MASNSSTFLTPSVVDMSSKYAPYGLTLAACAVVGSWLLSKRAGSSAHGASFPSPPADPILGHLRIMPETFHWVKFSEWAKKFGDVFYLSILGQPMIVLNTADSAKELMERRGANYSDRPPMVLHGELLAWGKMVAQLSNNDGFRLQRKFIHQCLNAQAVANVSALHTQETHKFLKNLLETPHDFRRHIERMTAAIVVKFTYGHEVLSTDDELVRVSVAATVQGVALGIPGLTPIDLFPFLKHTPSWFPGGGFQKKAKVARELFLRSMNEPYDKVVEERKRGIAAPSLVNDLIESNQVDGVVDPEIVTHIKYAAATMFMAGVETTEVTIATMILMMAHHPDVMRKAQAEIDRVVGNDQLPTLNDRPNMPYVECMLKEVFRVNAPLPLGIVHTNTTEDTYEGKYVPAGTMVASNIWHMMRDERIYSDPDTFNPDRFSTLVNKSGGNYQRSLDDVNGGDPTSLVYGFGRRICPGRYLADASIWMATTNLLAAFDVLPVLDPVTGKEVLPTIQYLFGFTSKPADYKVRIVPRSEKHAMLVRQECT